MKGHKVSVVMSVFNGERYIRYAIDSILGQSYRNIEFLIIDDGSIDGTRDILDDYNDSRIKIIRNVASEGLTKALNKGICMALGKYIARQDADDVSLPRRLEMQINFLDKHPDYGMVGSSYFKVDENGKILSQINVLSEDKEIRESIMAQNWFAHGSVMIRKDAFEHVCGYDERFKFAQDYDLWLRIIETFKVANISKPLYCWRISNSCISHTNWNEQMCYASQALQEAIQRKYFKERGSNNSPIVSIIINTYDSTEKLVEAIKSIMNQEYRNYEIIVVNDGGVDVQDIVARLNKNGNITYFRHENIKGVAAAKNTGLRLSKGKYVAYLDCDGIFYSNHLEILVKYLEVSDYKIAFTNAYRALKINEDSQYAISHRVASCSFEFDNNGLLIKSYIPAICVMHDKSCIDDVGYFDEDLKVYEEFDFWIRMSMKYIFAHINAFTCEYIYIENEKDKRNEKKEYCLWEIQTLYNKYESLCIEQGLTDSAKIFLKNIIENNPKNIKTSLKHGFLFLRCCRNGNLVNIFLKRLCFRINEFRKKRIMAKCLKGLPINIDVHI